MAEKTDFVVFSFLPRGEHYLGRGEYEVVHEEDHAVARLESQDALVQYLAELDVKLDRLYDSARLDYKRKNADGWKHYVIWDDHFEEEALSSGYCNRYPADFLSDTGDSLPEALQEAVAEKTNQLRQEYTAKIAAEAQKRAAFEAAKEKALQEAKAKAALEAERETYERLRKKFES